MCSSDVYLTFFSLTLCLFLTVLSLKDALCSVRFDNVEYQDDIGLVKVGILI